ncbi:helix-turn-helix domain-containing protein [Gracilibacillus boraciitolerans]|uniref:helix-turn-helix domain-containing protein n=1 Tax=Gracilibacillus boraciitolerans TaxID=307521 RepID=UPI0011DD3373|nr:AraC family transcriptional regulator [Gracilibacillus boraciitolerans]
MLEEEIYRRLYYLMNLYREKVIFTASSKIERALSYIQHNLHRVISLQEVAEHVQWNQNYFSEMFKKEIGMTYVEYVKQQRIKRAQELLRNSSDMRISDVARQVGYEDVKYFSQIFKAATGLTPPSKFQKR